MISIGNDIVSLKVIDIPRTQSPQFYSKILSPSEQQLYQEQFNTLPFGHFVWLLWSVKESVYKCLHRHDPHLLFSPIKTELTRLVAPTIPSPYFNEELKNIGFANNECFCSEVMFESRLFYARSVIYGDEVINTVAQSMACHDELIAPLSEGHPHASLRQAQAGKASLNPFNSIHWGIKQIRSVEPEIQSASVRAFLLEELRPLYPGKELSIVKNNTGCPFLFVDGVSAMHPISLSHHGEYVGYAF